MTTSHVVVDSAVETEEVKEDESVNKNESSVHIVLTDGSVDSVPREILNGVETSVSEVQDE